MIKHGEITALEDSKALIIEMSNVDLIVHG